jgi:hypothetical protein
MVFLESIGKYLPGAQASGSAGAVEKTQELMDELLVSCIGVEPTSP